MNTTGLSRHYTQLTPWERVPLILAAHQRGDEAEGERLARAAPVNTFRVPDHYGLSEGLRLVAAALRLDQLDLAAFYWRIETVRADWSAGPPDQGTKLRIARLVNIQKWLAFRFVALIDAWKLLCDELHIAPDFLERYFPGSETVKQLEEEARELAFTPDEALAYLRQRFEAAGGEGANVRRVYRIESVQDIVQTWREVLDEHRKAWA